MSHVDIASLIGDLTDRPYPGLRPFRRGERFIFFGPLNLCSFVLKKSTAS